MPTSCNACDCDEPYVETNEVPVTAVAVKAAKWTTTLPGPIRQRIGSVFHTYKDLLSLERHGARTPRNLFARIATRLLALAACISLDNELGRPSRAIVDYTAWSRGINHLAQ